MKVHSKCEMGRLHFSQSRSSYSGSYNTSLEALNSATYVQSKEMNKMY